jgi:hypothetical protein
MSSEFLQELEGCSLVVLGGKKARLLAQDVRESGKTVVEVPHVGNTALNRKFEVPDRLKLAAARARREHRIQLWTDAVLQAIAGEDTRPVQGTPSPILTPSACCSFSPSSTIRRA